MPLTLFSLLSIRKNKCLTPSAWCTTFIPLKPQLPHTKTPYGCHYLYTIWPLGLYVGAAALARASMPPASRIENGASVWPSLSFHGVLPTALVAHALT